MLLSSKLKYFFVFLYVGSAIGQKNVNDRCKTNDGNKGVCKLESDCKEAIKALKQTGVRPTLCGFSGSVSIICCTEAQVSNSNNQDEMCMRHCRHRRQAIDDLTEIKKWSQVEYDIGRNRPSIVGGEDTRIGEFPHMAAVGYENSSGLIQFNCGGTLISDYYVVTAAHCTFSRDLGAPKIVRLGDHALDRADDGAKPEDFPIQNITIHPEYKYPSKYHDIALIRLARPVKITSNIRPACIWRRQQIDTTSAVATGWGQLAYGLGGERPTALQKVELEIIEQSKCAALPALAPTTGRRGGLSKGLISQQMCAGDLINGGKDTCQGDSGGPLQITDPENSCVYHLIGVTSYGIGCGGVQSPGIYTRVSSYSDWIKSIVWP